jgi:hypothetical protein
MQRHLLVKYMVHIITSRFKGLTMIYQTHRSIGYFRILLWRYAVSSKVSYFINRQFGKETAEAKDFSFSPEVHKLWGVFPGGGASCLYEGHIYFERNIGER